jgi:hypothetical protein
MKTGTKCQLLKKVSSVEAAKKMCMTSSDREILYKFNNEKNLCGRFLPSQLNRDISTPKEKSTLWMAAATGVLTLLGVGDNEIQAQNQPATEIREDHPDILGKMIQSPAGNVISGTVTDATGPIPGANLVVKGTNIGTQTDIDGKFSIQCVSGQVLVVSYVGMKDVEVQVAKKASYNIVMRESVALQGEIVVGEPLVRKKSRNSK